MFISYYTSLSKNEISNCLAMAGWSTEYEIINIYTIDDTNSMNASEINFDIIRFGVDMQGVPYLWNGEVYHKVVSQGLNKLWTVAYVYAQNESTLLLSKSYKIEVGEFKKYLENDKIIKASTEKIIKAFPQINKIEVNQNVIYI